MVTNVRGPLIAALPVTGGTPDVRAPLIYTGALTGGAPDVRTPLTYAGALTAGNPTVRAPLIAALPVTGGNPSVRASLIVVSAVIPEPEDLPVATLIFPKLRGMTWDIKKSPEFNVVLHAATSGRRTKTAFMQYPVWHFEVAYDYLPDLAPGTSGYSDLQTLAGLFLTIQSTGQSFLYQDRDDYHVVAGPIAVGDGVTLQWPFVRNFGGFYEPVGQLDLSPLASFAASAVNTGTSAINVPAHGLTTGQGPLFLSTTGAPPAPLTANTPYWAIVVDANHFQLAKSAPAAALPTPITLTTTGSGTDTLAKGFAVYQEVTETDAVPATGPYTVTVAHAATFLADEGVTVSGAALVKVTGAPAAGQYAVTSAGVYTFNSAQASAGAAITYEYQADPTTVSLTLPNQLVISPAPTAGTEISADFDYYFVCDFTDNTLDLNQFMSKLWNLQKLDFQSVIQ